MSIKDMINKQANKVKDMVANADKLAKKIIQDEMPGYHDLFEESIITPAKIKTAIDAYRNEGKLQGLGNLMDLLLDSDDNLQSKILVRKSPLKRSVWSYGAELSKEKQEYFDALIRQNLSAWVDVFLEGKLYGWQFQQVMYDFDGAKYRPTDLLTYSNLDLRKDKKRLVLYGANGKPVELAPLKFISILYRRPTLHSLLKYYVFYAYALNHWAQFVETYGKPPRIGKYDAMSTPKEVEVLKAAVKALGTDQAAVISKNTEIEFKDFAGKDSSKTLYDTLCAFVTSRVTNAILGQPLTTDKGNGGSYALGNVQDQVQDDIVEGDLTDFSHYVNTLLGYVDSVNFGGTGVGVYFEIFKPVNMTERIAIDEKLVALGLPIAEEYFYSTYNVDKPAKGQKVVQGKGLPGAVPNAEGTAKDTNSMKIDSGLRRNDSGGRYDSEAGVVACAEGIAKSLAKLREQIRAAKNLKELKAIDYTWFSHALGADLAAEAVKGYVAGRGTGRSANADGLPEIKFEWDERGIGTANAFRNEAYIISTVRTGQSFKQLWDDAAQLLEKGGDFTDFIKQADLAGFAPDNPYHLKTEYETAIASADMAGRWAEIEADSDLFPYLRYVTMQDELVRDEHVALDGTIAAVDDSFWNENYPPNGYNCRCGVEQVTAAEAGADPKFGEGKPVIAIAEQFQGNVGKTDKIASDAYDKLWQYAQRVIDQLPTKANSQSANADKPILDGQIKDVQNYPVLIGTDASADIIHSITNPNEIWHNELFESSYIKRFEGYVMQVICRKGKLVEAKKFEDYRNEGRSGVREYGL